MSSNPYAVKTSAVPSQPSQPSPSKTCLGIFISHSDLTVGDRVRYVGQRMMYVGSLGKITEVCGDRYICDFAGNLTKQLTREELEAIS